MRLITYHDASLNISDIDLYKDGWLNDRCIYFGCNLLQYSNNCHFDINNPNYFTNSTTLCNSDISSTSTRDINTNVVNENNANNFTVYDQYRYVNMILKFIDPSIISFMKLQCVDDDEYHDLAVGLGLIDMDLNNNQDRNVHTDTETNPDIYRNSKLNNHEKHSELIREEYIFFLPINDSDSLTTTNQGSHWSLIVLHINDKIAYHLDSCRSHPRQHDKQMKAVRETINAFSKVLRYTNLSSLSLLKSDQSHDIDISIVEYRDTPQQCNGNDCGIYVLLFMQRISEFLIKGKGISLDKEEKCIKRESKSEISDVTMVIKTAIDTITGEDRQTIQKSAIALRKHFVSMLTSLSVTPTNTITNNTI